MRQFNVRLKNGVSPKASAAPKIDQQVTFAGDHC